LDSLTPKIALLRDRVRGVAEGYGTGLYAHGPGGTGKSFNVLDELNTLRVPYHLHNSRMTGRGLVDVLQPFPDDVHVLEDCESMLGDRLAWGVLRSALWSQSQERFAERLVTWNAHRVQISFVFSGGIILVANRPVDDIPELQAVKTRIPVIGLNPSRGEMTALIRSLALKGFRFGDDFIPPAECWRISEFVVHHTNRLDRLPDARVFVNACKDYLMHRDGHSDLHWHDLTLTAIAETAALPRERGDCEKRAPRLRREAALALELAALDLPQAERMALWREKTGGSVERTYWRALARAKGERP
jgi:hypothetical protein